MDEMVLFPTEGAHDDQVDAVSGAYNELAREAGFDYNHSPDTISFGGIKMDEDRKDRYGY